MKKLYLYLPLTLAISALTFNCLTAGNALAQEADSVKEVEKMVVSRPSVMMTRAPRGGKMGELYINSPVEVIKQEGDWVLVNLNAWMKKDGLSKVVRRKASSNSAKPSQILVINDFSTKVATEGLPTKRVYLKLKLKNNTAKEINDWTALLVAKVDGEVAFREGLSDDSKTIGAGQQMEVNFYWEPEEKPFKIIEKATKENTSFEMYNVEINKSLNN